VNPSRLFIERPVATALLMIAILLAGIVAYRQLPLSALPEVDYPTIQVVTLYPGASPDVVTSSITAPLERQFGQMPGLKQMSSTSSGGASVITLQFELSMDLDSAEQEVQAAINAGGNLLPTDLPAPPIYSKVNPADAAIITLGITSKTMPMTQVQNLVDTRLAQKISQIPGVGLVTLSGGQRPAVRVQVNPKAIASQGLSMDDLRTAIANANTNQAKGSFDGPTRAYTIDANDQLRSADEYRSIIVAYRNGAPIYLTDVADVIDGAENARLAAWMNETPAIIVNVQRQPGANVIDVVDRVKQLLPSLTAALPAAVEVQLLTDRTVTIRASVKDTQFELMLAIALVVMVIFVFLRSATATLIPAAAGAIVHRRHLRRHVPRRVQHQQPHAHGAHHRDRVRRRRRDRGDREHRALRGAGRGPDAGRAERLAPDRLHHHLAHVLAHRGPDPAPLHGRGGGAPLP